MMKFNKAVIRIAERLRSTKSKADARLILEEIRKDRVCQPNISYEEILQRRLFFKEIYRSDAKFPIFEEDVAEVLEGKNHDEQILLLTQMVIMC